MQKPPKLHISIRFTPEQHRQIKRASIRSGMPIAAIAKQSALAKADEIEAKHFADIEKRKHANRHKSVPEIEGYKPNALLRKPQDSVVPRASASSKDASKMNNAKQAFESMKVFVQGAENEDDADARLEVGETVIADVADSAVEADQYVTQLQDIANNVKRKLLRKG